MAIFKRTIVNTRSEEKVAIALTLDELLDQIAFAPRGEVTVITETFDSEDDLNR